MAGWQIEKSWEKTDQGYYLLRASNPDIIKECKNNPTHYIKFPSIIHSYSKPYIKNFIIGSNSSSSFKNIRGFYGSLVMPCISFKEVPINAVLNWEAVSYTRYFSRFHHFPKTTPHFPKSNFFNETLNITGAAIVLILCVLYIVLFRGKISNAKLLSLISSNFFIALYFICNTAELYGLSISMLTAHKIADLGLWIGFAFFINFLYLENLILRWMNICYTAIVSVAVMIIITASNGDVVQLGTSLPFLFTMIFSSYAIFKLIKKGKLKSKKELIQLLAIIISTATYFNDLFVVLGVIDSSLFLPIGISSSYTFILISVNESITKTYQERDQLKALTKELELANINLKKTQDQLIKSEKMAAMGRAVARIAHELNTPIYIARSSAQNIQSQLNKAMQLFKEDEKYVNNLAKIQDYRKNIEKMMRGLMSSISRAATLVRDFKEISTDQVNIRKKEFKLLSYIRTSLNSMQDFIEKRNLDIRLSGDDVLIYSNPGLFYQIIQNLITNSIKYAYNNGGKIDIEVKALDKKIVIVFSDYGKGIKKDFLNKIFDPFFTTAGGKGGSGLGLNIVYKIVTNTLDGNIICKSQENEGATFEISIAKYKLTKDED